MSKTTNIHTISADELYSIAESIRIAANKPRGLSEKFITTKEKQIEFMWHLYGQGFTAKEIGEVYNITGKNVDAILMARVKNKPVMVRKRK